MIRIMPEERAAVVRRIDVISDLLRYENHSAPVLGALSREQMTLRQILAASMRTRKSPDAQGRRLAHLKEIAEIQGTRSTFSHFALIIERYERTETDPPQRQVSESDRIQIDRFLAEHGVVPAGLTVEELYTILGKLTRIDTELDTLSLREQSADETAIATVLIRGRTALRARLVDDSRQI